MKIIHFASACLAIGAVASADPVTGESGAERARFSPFTSLNLSDDVTLKIGGRLLNDWTWAHGEAPFDDKDGVEFRAARIKVEGTIYDLVGYKAEYDFAGGDADFKDVYLSVKDTPAGSVKLGNFKEPFSLDQQTSSRFTTFAERSLMDALVPGRSQGVMFSDMPGECLNWQAGFFRAADDFGNNNTSTSATSEDGEYAITGRVAGTVWNEDEGTRVLHLGGAYSLRQPDEGGQSYSARPEAHLLSSVASSTMIPADFVHLGGLEAAWVEGPFSLQSEIVHSGIDADSGSSDADYLGYYVEGSYFLTGESRNYKASGAKFDRVHPHENFTRDGGRGAHQLALRYSMLDLNDGPDNDELENITLGWNWYLNPNTIVKLNYIRSMYDSGAVDADADIVVLRFQVDF